MKGQTGLPTARPDQQGSFLPQISFIRQYIDALLQLF